MPKVSEDTHTILCHTRTYGKKEEFGKFYDSVYIHSVKRCKIYVELLIHAKFRIKVPIYVQSNYIWILKSDWDFIKEKLQAADAKKRIREERDVLIKKKEECLATFLKAYIVAIFGDCDVSLSVVRGRVKNIRAKGVAGVEKFKGRLVDELL